MNFIINKDLKTFCCEYKIPNGTELKICKIHSPKRILVLCIGGKYDGTLHIVRTTTMRIVIDRKFVKDYDLLLQTFVS